MGTESYEEKTSEVKKLWKKHEKTVDRRISV